MRNTQHSTLEHISQIHASLLNARAASPTVAVGDKGGSLAGRVGQDTSGQMMIRVSVPYRVVGLVVRPKGSMMECIQQDSSSLELLRLPNNCDWLTMYKKPVHRLTAGLVYFGPLAGRFGLDCCQRY